MDEWFALVGQLVLVHAARDNGTKTVMLKIFIGSPVAIKFAVCPTPEIKPNGEAVSA